MTDIVRRGEVADGRRRSNKEAAAELTWLAECIFAGTGHKPLVARIAGAACSCR